MGTGSEMTNYSSGDEDIISRKVQQLTSSHKETNLQTTLVFHPHLFSGLTNPG